MLILNMSKNLHFYVCFWSLSGQVFLVKWVTKLKHEIKFCVKLLDYTRIAVNKLTQVYKIYFEHMF